MMAENSELWSLSRVTSWLPGETLFSLVSRHHIISGNCLPSQTCLQMFGHPKQGSAHDFPCRVGEFIRRTGGELGDANQVVRKHTVLPYYFPYRSPADTEHAVAAVCYGGVGGLKGRLGILSSRLGASHQLKACAKCAAEDRDLHRVAYWHLEHQWPGCWVCPRHSSPLRYALYKVNGAGRFHWLLPFDSDHALGIDPGYFEELRSELIGLVDCAHGLTSLEENFYFDSAVLCSTYLGKLIEMDCAFVSGRIKPKDVICVLEKVCAPLSRVRGFETLNCIGLPLLNQFSRLLQLGAGPAHPLRHFLLVLALFGDWTSFMAAYRLKLEKADRQCEIPDIFSSYASRESAEQQAKLHRKFKLIEAVKSGLSPTAAAKTHGVSVATAMTWLAAVGIGTSRRAKVLVEPLRGQTIMSLRQGGAKSDAALAAGVSMQSITLLLRTEPGLGAAWKQSRFDLAQLEARTSWTKTAEKLRPATPKFLRNLKPAVFAWLYRNDRSWLEEFASGLSRTPRSHGATIKWDERDRNLSRAVQAAALAIHTKKPGHRPKLSALCDHIPSLKARLSDLDQLPLTKIAIAEVTRRRRES